MFFIMLVGLFLRLTFIDKMEGLWNDEYVSWFVASTDWNNIWTEITKQCHMPLYYLYLKPFTGCSDLILRLTSLIPGVFSIYIMYLVGKEYSKKNRIIRRNNYIGFIFPNILFTRSQILFACIFAFCLLTPVYNKNS